MEDTYNEAGTDPSGLRYERGGACSTEGQCRLTGDGEVDEVAVTYPGNKFPAYDWHTHGNEGKSHPSGGTFGFGPSRDKDLPAVKGESKNGRTTPSYIFGRNRIYVQTPDGKGGVELTSYPRWER